MKEQPVAHYSSQINGTTITNTLINDEETTISGNKLWEDNQDKLKLRPDYIVVDLFQNDSKQAYQKQVVRADSNGNWTYKFSHLPKYDKEMNGYKYTVKEQSVKYYTSRIEGTTIINTISKDVVPIVPVKPLIPPKPVTPSIPVQPSRPSVTPVIPATSNGNSIVGSQSSASRLLPQTSEAHSEAVLATLLGTIVLSLSGAFIVFRRKQ
ncbi:hypothetical protein CBF37_09940 [Vagococcus vulneris]|uniref:Gram-positive cocci surface proteins LPxTG domain-containing protein n=1 Tax=Vagococcus vulneris TaxID=1977869 RepID=A0A429ZUM9_9ENTE|nr:hypothetical protein CBF37_09940 [Vagococcus vulneris]